MGTQISQKLEKDGHPRNGFGCLWEGAYLKIFCESLLVHLAAMANSDDEHYKTILLEFANDSIVAHAIAPKTG